MSLAIGLVVAEAAASAALRLRRYELRDTLANLTMGAGGLLSGAVGRAAALPISYALWSHRAFDLPRTWWVFATTPTSTRTSAAS